MCWSAAGFWLESGFLSSTGLKATKFLSQHWLVRKAGWLSSHQRQLQSTPIPSRCQLAVRVAGATSGLGSRGEACVEQEQAGAGGGCGWPVGQQDRAETRLETWRDTTRVRPAQIVPRHTQGWMLVHLQHGAGRVQDENQVEETWNYTTTCGCNVSFYYKSSEMENF